MKKTANAQSFELQGSNNTALLFLHGFTGSPSEVYPAAELLHQQSRCTVSGIALPGHGTTPEDCEHTTWRDWTAAVEYELNRLSSSHQYLFVGGLSMGGLLSFYAATQREDIKGVVSINAPVFTRNPLTTSWFVSALTPILGLVKPYYPKQEVEDNVEFEKQGRQAYHCYPIKSFRSMLHLRKLVLARLCSVKCPALVMQSLQDEVVNASSGKYLVNRLKRTEVSYRELEQSGHVATMGAERDLIAEYMAQFIDDTIKAKGE